MIATSKASERTASSRPAGELTVGDAHAVVLEQQAHGGEHVLLIVGDDDARGVGAR